MRKKILIIDDDTYIRDMYEEVLKEADFYVDTAIDGEQGLSKLRQGEYDLVLLDMMMPRIDGIGVLNSLKENLTPAKSGTIVLLSNLDNDPKIEEALQKGAKAYLIKSSMTPEQFLNNVKTFI